VYADAGHLQRWIEHKIFLGLADAQFSKEDAQLVPEAGACIDCPKRNLDAFFAEGEEPLSKAGYLQRCAAESAARGQARQRDR
jgi:hypothetical protein